LEILFFVKTEVLTGKCVTAGVIVDHLKSEKRVHPQINLNICPQIQLNEDIVRQTMLKVG
jgi:hypothetical protein